MLKSSQKKKNRSPKKLPLNKKKSKKLKNLSSLKKRKKNPLNLNRRRPMPPKKYWNRLRNLKVKKGMFIYK